MTEETLVDALLAQIEARRLMTGWCIAYRADGQVCRAPAHIVDRQRGGPVCAVHAPAYAADPASTAARIS